MERASERERQQGVERSLGQPEAAAADAVSHPLLQLERQLGNARVVRLQQRASPLEEETAATTQASVPTSETGQALGTMRTGTTTQAQEAP